MIFRADKKLGFGLMRLPVLEDKSIDIEQLIQMVDLYMEHGFNYFDTAYLYHGGASETAIKEALVDRYPRDSYTLATKLPAWVIRDDKNLVQKVFDDQLQKTGVEYFDYYLLHSVVMPHIPVYEGHGCWEWGQRMKAEGKIRYFGFSFHDTADVLEELLKKHPEVDFVQLQINYLDWENDLVQSRACYEVATRFGIPVTVMEPVKGGVLADLPADAAALLHVADPNASQASWGIRFSASLENVKMVLSGMSSMAQMQDNLRTMENFKPLTEAERSMLFSVAEKILSVPTAPCTGCGYCADGCPQNIPIPVVLRYLNNVKRFGANLQASTFYKKAVEGCGAASDCIHCGQCELVCPQHIEITKYLEEAAEAFDK